MGDRLWVIGLVCLLSIAAWAQEVTTDTAVQTVDTIVNTPTQPPKKMAQVKIPIYQGTTIKLDIGSAVVAPAISRGQLQQYELAVNVRLLNRIYPTLEAGYAGGRSARGDSIAYTGHGGFFRVGCDINPLKKHPESPHALLIGVRLGTAVQQAEHVLHGGMEQKSGVRADCWGEIVAGCQVQIAAMPKSKMQGGFYMGWMGRLKCLFTRQPEGLPANETRAIYIPGFGNRDNIGWGISYHIGWKF